MSDGGKGSTQRPETQPGAYASGWDRIFGKDAEGDKEVAISGFSEHAPAGGQPRQGAYNFKETPCPEQ